MPAFTNDQWVIVALVFLLGAVIGMILMAGGKWKRRYREESARVRELEAENARLRKEAGEMDTLRQAAARDEARRRVDGPGPL
ncbi:MAG: LapA family protein [Alphaproteobacteria bacterium]|nr:LapA family protein [Alphaproteobacteria bacterium]MBV9370518.1 LapA family protein [Alphaproteobacteria bacterium]MBV9901419.1 LapA family protein [Alphaproteobacteria bacterium]